MVVTGFFWRTFGLCWLLLSDRSQSRYVSILQYHAGSIPICFSRSRLPAKSWMWNRHVRDSNENFEYRGHRKLPKWWHFYAVCWSFRTEISQNQLRKCPINHIHGLEFTNCVNSIERLNHRVYGDKSISLPPKVWCFIKLILGNTAIRLSWTAQPQNDVIRSDFGRNFVVSMRQVV